MAATPRPWRIIGRATVIGNGEEAPNIALCTRSLGEERAEANARLIVQAVNAFPELVDACRAALGFLELQSGDGIAACREQIRVALQKAKQS